MTERHKDGVDELWPTVLADDWREAMALGGERITYRCPDGITITFGKAVWIGGKKPTQR
jgi:hypothetical protein